jgi:nitroreductase
LGAVWLGVYPREERVAGLRKLLGIPEHVIPFSLIPIGYPAEQKPRANRYDISRVHDNRW